MPDFTGRATQIGRLLQCFQDGAAVIVHGPPGVGKTALAVHAATRAAGGFPGGVHYLDGRGAGPAPADPVDLAGRLRRAFGAQPRGRRLVVLDNIADERQLAPLLPAVGAGALVVTSRCPLPRIDGAVGVPLPPLTIEESAALLSAVTGAPADASAAAVAEHCGHLPLALRIAGNRLTGRPGWTMAHLAARLADEERRLATLSTGDVSVVAALAPAFARLSGPARALCRQLATAGVQDVDVASARAAIDELVAAGLLQTEGGGYRCHELVRLFARHLDR